MLKQIFEAITPENIKSIKFIEDAMGIFIECLEEHSMLSVEIKNLFDENLYLDNLERYLEITDVYEAQLDELKIQIDAKYNILKEFDDYYNLSSADKDAYNVLSKEYNDLKTEYYNISNDDVYLKYKSLITLLESANINVRESISKTYLNNLHTIIGDAKKNQRLNVILDQFPDNIPLKKDTTNVLNDEYFFSNKQYKQTIGTKKGIEYSYGFAKYLERNDTTPDEFTVTPKIPYYFHATGRIYKETYESIVKPMSHPVGFTYYYKRTEDSLLSDFYDTKSTLVEDFGWETQNGYYFVTSDAVDLESDGQDGYYLAFNTTGTDTNGFYLVSLDL